MFSTGARRARAVERLAEKMYQAGNPGLRPWLRLGWGVREVWMKRASQVLENGSPSISRLMFWRRAGLP